MKKSAFKKENFPKLSKTSSKSFKNTSKNNMNSKIQRIS